MVQNRYKPLGKKHERFVERVKKHSELVGRVVFCDLTESVLETVGKFVTYALFVAEPGVRGLPTASYGS